MTPNSSPQAPLTTSIFGAGEMNINIINGWIFFQQFFSWDGEYQGLSEKNVSTHLFAHVRSVRSLTFVLFVRSFAHVRSVRSFAHVLFYYRNLMCAHVLFAQTLIFAIPI